MGDYDRMNEWSNRNMNEYVEFLKHEWKFSNVNEEIWMQILNMKCRNMK